VTSERNPLADAIIGLYERHAAAWADVRRSERFIERPWIDKFAALVPPGATVLDIGCGAGEPIARFLAGSGFAVTGVDASQALIDVARANLPNIDWRVGDMRALALDRTFDGLLAWHSFFHLGHDDQRGMFDVFARHAAPRAALMFTSGPEAGEALGQFEGEALYHASLDPAEYRALLAAAGFNVIEHVAHDRTTGDSTIWIAQRRG